MSKRVFLITGIAGFVGHHFLEHILKNTDDVVVGIDSLTYSGSLDRLRDIEIDPFHHPRFKYLSYDFRQPTGANFAQELQDVTHILHIGAESHVDHSISDPMRFVMANVVGTTNMLELAKMLPKLELFVYFSTDEVFGPAPLPAEMDANDDWHGYREDDTHNPKNPYAATKSAGEQMVTSFANTYGLPCIITRQMNIFGERQHPEKFIPKVINAVLNDTVVPIHATPDKKQAGMRHYIHARNVAHAHLFLLDKKPWVGSPPRSVPSYHIVGEVEVDNLTLAQTIADTAITAGAAMGLKTHPLRYDMVDFHSARPGHDLRYALNGGKMRELGWAPPKNFHDSLVKTIEWSLNSPRWLKNSGL